MVRGVYLVDQKKAYEARWKEAGKNRSKRFSISTHGHDMALTMAHEERAKHGAWVAKPHALHFSGHNNISWSKNDNV